MSSSSSSTVPPELDNLSNDQLRIFREAFNVIDPSGEGFIMRTDVGTAMRALALHPSETELTKLLNDVVPSGKVDFVSFCVIVARQMSAIRNVPAMVKAFSVFDTAGTGYITVSVLREVFEKIGDIPLQPEIVDELIAFADPEETGQIYYEPLVSRMFTEFEIAKKLKDAGNQAKKG